MASTDKSVTLTVGANVTGTGDLDKLADDLRGIAQAGTEAGPAFQQLATDLDAASQKTEALRTTEAAARAEVSASKAALDTQRESLARLRIETDSAGKTTDDYKAKVKAQQLAILDSRSALREKQAALQSAAGASKTAAASEAQLTQQVQQAQSAMARQGAAAAVSASQNAAASARITEGFKGVADQLRAVQAIAAGALGGSLLGGFIGELSQTADAFTALKGRIALVTGQGPLLESTFQGVADVAQATNSNLQATGELFVKVAQAAQSAGVSASDASNQSLALTRVVTEAMAISGASADEAHRAMVQFAQALSVGTLRSQDFHSIAEQTPGVLSAMAAGLGKTSGELKKMADAGELTTQVVTSALLSQSAAVEAQFSQLPVTVGRAVENLRTSWTLYIGSASQASGVSATAAAAINTLAHNLDTLGELLYSAGKAAAAYKAVKLAQTFLDIGTAAKVATAEVAALNAAQAGSAAASAGAAAGMGRFAALLGSLKVAGLVGILVNIKEIGTALGEGVARWAGWGKAIDELDAANKRAAEAAREAAAAHAAQAQATQLAADKALGLSDASRKLVGDFQKVITDGGEVQTALEGVQKALELKDTSGIASAGQALDALAVRGQITASQVSRAWQAGLKDIDLGLFATQAASAFDNSEQGARRLKAALDAVSQESLRRANTSVQELQSGFSTAAASAIGDVDALAATLEAMGIKGSDASRAVGAALDNALGKAGTEKAVQAIIDRFVDLGKQGLISGDQLAQGLQKAKDKLDQLTPGVNSLSEAMHAFGLKSQAELQTTADKFKQAWQQIANSTDVSLADKAKAFEQFSAAATAANKGVVPSEVELQGEILKSQGAAIDLGKAISDAMNDAGDSVKATAEQVAALHKIMADDVDRHSAPHSKPQSYAGTYTSLTANADLGNLRQKQLTGSLSGGDLDAANRALEQAKNNQQWLNATLAQSPGAVSQEAITSSRGDVAAATQLLSIIRGLAQGSSKTTAAPAAGAPGSSTYVVNVNLDGRQEKINVASRDDQDAAVRVLQAVALTKKASR